MASKFKRHRQDIEDEMEELSLTKNTDTTQNNNWPHFLIIESNDKNRPVTALSPFVLDKSFKACAGTVKTVKKLRSGVILVEVEKKQQSDNLLGLKSILDLSITVSPHRTLNTCRGVIRSYDLAQIEEDVLLQELSPQGVIDFKSISATRDGKRKRTNTAIVTFDSAT